MVSVRSEKPIRAAHGLSRFPNVAFETGITTVDVSHRLAHKSYVILTTHIGPEPRLTVTLTGWSQKHLTIIINRWSKDSSVITTSLHAVLQQMRKLLSTHCMSLLTTSTGCLLEPWLTEIKITVGYSFDESIRRRYSLLCPFESKEEWLTCTSSWAVLQRKSQNGRKLGQVCGTKRHQTKSEIKLKRNVLFLGNKF